MRKSILFIPMLMCLALIAEAVPPSGTWDQYGEALNVNPAKKAEFPSLAVYNGTPYVCWVEEEGTTRTVHVKYYDASNTWSSYGGSVSGEDDVPHTPDIAISSIGTVYVCWQDIASGSGKIYVRHYNGGSWVQDGVSLNVNLSKYAQSPTIAISNGTPYVCWQEFDGVAEKIYVRYFKDNIWKPQVSLNIISGESAGSPAIAIYNGTPYVSWQERNGTGEQIYVKHYNGASWEQAGGSLNEDLTMNANSPAIAVSNGTPYVSWQESNGTVPQIYVKYYNGVHWAQEGTSLNVDLSTDAQASAIAVYNGTPYVCWQERNEIAEQIYVKYFKDGVWKGGGSLNIDSAKAASLPDIAVSNDTLYVCWQELNALVSKIYVKHYVAYTPTASPTPSAVTPEITEIPTTEVTPEVTKTPAVVKLTPAIPAVPFMVHPNVLRTSTGQPVRITLRIDRSQRVILKIYTRGGKLVKTLVDSVINAKTFETVWEGIDRKGRVVPTGIYLVYIKTDDFSEKRKIVVVR